MVKVEFDSDTPTTVESVGQRDSSSRAVAPGQSTPAECVHFWLPSKEERGGGAMYKNVIKAVVVQDSTQQW